MRLTKVLGIVLVALVVVSCASKPKDGPELTEGGYYKRAQKLLKSKNYDTAIKRLQDLQERFPYGDYAEQAQLDLIYAQYKSLDFPSSVAAAQRYVRLYPASAHVDYALYMEGLGNYYMNRSMLDRFFPKDEAARDMGSMRDAFKNFQELVRRYPDSPFAPDARARMVFIRNELARHELYAARYYARRHAFIAAANRAQYVVLHYQETPSVAEALAIMSKSYRELNEPALAKKSRQVLAANYPDSGFMKNGKVYIEWWPSPEGRGWLSFLTFGLL